MVGGNKSVLGNLEYLINIAGPVRLVLFYDAGQVRDVGEHFAWKEDLTAQRYPPQLTGIPLLYDPFAVGSLQNPLDVIPRLETVVTGQANAFKTSTGAEIRFFMPVLNVPFTDFCDESVSGRGADSNLRPEKKYKSVPPSARHSKGHRTAPWTVLTLKGCHMSVQKVPEIANARKAKLKLTISTMCAVMFAQPPARRWRRLPAPAPGTQKPTPPAPTAPRRRLQRHRRLPPGRAPSRSLRREIAYVSVRPSPRTRRGNWRRPSSMTIRRRGR